MIEEMKSKVVVSGKTVTLYDHVAANYYKAVAFFAKHPDRESYYSGGILITKQHLAYVEENRS